jgi:hypothetical protein
MPDSCNRRSDFKRPCDVAEPSPEAAPVEVTEAEVAVEVGCLGGESIDNDGSRAEFAAAAHTARARVDEQVSAKGSPLLGAIEREAA